MSTDLLLGIARRGISFPTQTQAWVAVSMVVLSPERTHGIQRNMRIVAWEQEQHSDLLSKAYVNSCGVVTDMTLMSAQLSGLVPPRS